MPPTTLNKGVQTDWDLGEAWKTGGDANWRLINDGLWLHWSTDRATTTGLTYGYRGGPAVSADGSVTTIADGTIAVADDDTSVIYRDAAGNVDTAVGSDVPSGMYGMAVVTAASGVIDLATIEDIRVPAVQMPPGVSQWKQPVRCATTGAGTLATSFEDGDSVDGVTLATGDRVLIKDQSAGAENGIYEVNASGAPTRTADADSADDLLGLAVVVLEGTTHADTIWLLTTDSPITVDTTALAFAQVGGGAPAAHATTHQSGGSDPIKLDDLAAPDDNTDLDATASAHGLTKKLGATNTMLTSDGTNQQWVNIVTHAQITEGASMDADMGNRFSGAFYLSADLAGNRTIAVSNCPNGGCGTIVGSQDGTGGHTLTISGGTNLIVGGAGDDELPITSDPNAEWVVAFVRINDVFYWTVGAAA